nr:hypothetical protein CFP56_14450 [Quercus suber]
MQQYPSRRPDDNSLGHNADTLAISNLVGSVNAVEMHIEGPGNTMSMEVVRSGGSQMHDKHVHGNDTAGPQKQILNFKAMIRDIDEAINHDLEFLNSKGHNLNPSVAMISNDVHIENNTVMTKDLGSNPQNLKNVEDNLPTRISRESSTKVKFEVGQVDNSVDRKANKGIGWWHLRGFYGNSDTAKRPESWAKLRHLKGTLTLPWPTIGDFSEITGALEKEGGNDRPRQERLDRAMATLGQINILPKAKLFQLTSSVLDHSPLALRMVQKLRNKKARKTFRFESMWPRDRRCEEVV